MQTPHCDSRILHRQGECEYCDRHPEWQKLRELWGIAFTGHSYDDPETYLDWEGNVKVIEKDICPSEKQRPLEVIEKWSGNRKLVPIKKI